MSASAGQEAGPAQRMRAPESLRSVSQIPTLPAAPIADRLITQTNASLRPGHRAAMPSRCRCLLSRYCAGHYREPAAFRFCPREVGWRWAAGIHFWRWLNCGVRCRPPRPRRQVQILARSVTGRAEEVPASRGAAFSRYEHKAGFKRDGGESPVLLVGEPTNDFAHVQRATFLNCEVVPLREIGSFQEDRTRSCPTSAEAICAWISARVHVRLPQRLRGDSGGDSHRSLDSPDSRVLLTRNQGERS